MMPSRIIKRSIVVEHHKTSVSMEKEFWDCLQDIARKRSWTLSKLVSQIDMGRTHNNLSSAIRLYVLDVVQKQAAAQGRGASP